MNLLYIPKTLKKKEAQKNIYIKTQNSQKTKQNEKEKKEEK